MFSFENFKVIFELLFKYCLKITEINNNFKIRHYLKGKKKGSTEVFANLPGLGDTIRLTSNNTILAPISMIRQLGKLSIFDLFSQYPTIRNILGSVCTLIKFIFNGITNFYFW